MHLHQAFEMHLHQVFKAFKFIQQVMQIKFNNI